MRPASTRSSALGPGRGLPRRRKAAANSDATTAAATGRPSDGVAGGFFEGAAFASSPPPLPPFASPSSPRQPCRTLASGGDCCRPVGVCLGWHRRRWLTVKAAMPTLRLRHDVKFPEFKFTDLHVLFHYIKLSYVYSLNINTLFMCSID